MNIFWSPLLGTTAAGGLSKLIAAYHYRQQDADVQILKADTETKVVIGRVVSVSDGFTPVTTLALTTADEAEILKHDAAAVTDISGNTFAAITGADGAYNLTLTAAQLDTEGRLTVIINDDSLCLPIERHFQVVSANVFDSMYAAAGTDYLQTDAIQIEGLDATDQVNAACDTAITDAALATAAALATVDGNVDAILVDTGTTLPATLGTPAADVSADIAAVKAETALIVADTNELQTDNVPGLIAALNDLSAADVLATQLTESYAADGAAPTLTQALMMIQQKLGDFAISGTTLTVKKVDGATTAATFTLSDASNPTSITRAT